MVNECVRIQRGTGQALEAEQGDKMMMMMMMTMMFYLIRANTLIFIKAFKTPSRLLAAPLLY